VVIPAANAGRGIRDGGSGPFGVSRLVEIAHFRERVAGRHAGLVFSKHKGDGAKHRTRDAECSLDVLTNPPRTKTSASSLSGEGWPASAGLGH
jgi:hypothetical protein